MDEKNYGWSLKNEINFIKGLGMGVFAKESARVKGRTRKFMLESYIKAAKLRDWGPINGREAIKFAKSLL